MSEDSVKNPNMSLIEIAKFFGTDVISRPNLLIPPVSFDDYLDSLCPEGYSKENFSGSTPQILMGQGITNNGGLQLAQVIGGKQPNYQDLQNNTSHTVIHHKKTMLDGLLLSNGFDAPATTFKTLNDLSSKSLLLPISSSPEQLGARSMNGLPYYDENECLYKISKLSKEDKLRDLENTHGAVILNQLLGNKRKLRNYQWMQYFADRTGNSLENNLQQSLKSTIREGTRLLDDEALIKEEEDQQEKLKQAQMMNNEAGSVIEETPEQKEAILKLRLLLKEARIINRQKDQELRKDIKNRKRFIYDGEAYIRDLMKDTVVVEEEVITQNLNYIPNYRNNQPPEVRKLVRKRRKPNANSIGHSNIRGVKPTYWR